MQYLEEKGLNNVTAVITKQLRGRMATVVKRSELINKSVQEACDQSADCQQETNTHPQTHSTG